jgi:heat shock protein HtpX
MEAVLGHELTHIRNGDVRMMVIAVVIAGAISFFAELFFRLWFYGGVRFGSRRSDGEGRGRGGNGLAILIAVALIAVAWILSLLIRFALSRSREFLADAGAVELTKNPDAMISALRKIEGRGELPGATSAVMEMCLDNPREGFSNLFSTHPSVESRVKALIETAGGHDPGPIALPPPEEPAQDALPPPPGEAGPWGSAADQPGTHPGPWGTASDSAAPHQGPWGPSPPPPPPMQPPPPPPQTTPAPSRPFLPDRPPIDPGAPGGPWGKSGG